MLDASATSALRYEMRGTWDIKRRAPRLAAIDYRQLPATAAAAVRGARWRVAVAVAVADGWQRQGAKGPSAPALKNSKNNPTGLDVVGQIFPRFFCRVFELSSPRNAQKRDKKPKTKSVLANRFRSNFVAPSRSCLHLAPPTPSFAPPTTDDL
jgi:hypothetical protein